jgi:hypothetical protein
MDWLDNRRRKSELECQRATEREVEAWDMWCRITFLLEIMRVDDGLSNCRSLANRRPIVSLAPVHLCELVHRLSLSGYGTSCPMVPGDFPPPHDGPTITAPSSQPGGAVSSGESTDQL